jgi:transposase
MGFHVADQAARDLMIVQLCEHGGVTEMEVARAFDISRPTISRAKSKYAEDGVEGLVPKKGPKGPTKIKDYKEQRMIEMARAGWGWRSWRFASPSWFFRRRERRQASPRRTQRTSFFRRRK